jgi:hypothetical protein
VIGLVQVVVEDKSKVFVCTLFKRCIPNWGGIGGAYQEHGFEFRANVVLINKPTYIGRYKVQVFVRS